LQWYQAQHLQSKGAEELSWSSPHQNIHIEKGHRAEVKDQTWSGGFVGFFKMYKSEFPRAIDVVINFIYY